MFLLWFALLGGSFVFLDVGPSLLFLVLSLSWVLWLIYYWQGFIIYTYMTKKLDSVSVFHKYIHTMQV